jgi:photosystem II stability/assembly factor-like uncharacterized protein
MQPDNPDIMYVTASPGGIFKSADGGETWFSVTAGIEKSPGYGADIFCATVDPHDHNTIWAGTQFIAHIYRSTDGGSTWEQRDNGIITLYEESVRGITIDPADPNVVYAGVEVAMYPGSPGMLFTRGKVYKTTDAGLNWTLIWEGDNLARYIWIDPRNSQRVYVSTGIFDRGAANCDTITKLYGGVGVLRSDDGGQNWTVLDGKNGLYGLFIPSLFMHPTDPEILLAAATAEGCLPGAHGLYVTRNGGETWDVAFPEPFTDAVEIATSNTDVWYVAGSNHIARSDDAGQTWEMFQMETADRLAGFPIDLQVDPRDPYRIFVNNYAGGNMLSTDGGETWMDASQGYTGAQVGELTVDPNSSRTAFAQGVSGAFRTEDGGETWVARKRAPYERIYFHEWDSGSEILGTRVGSGWMCRSTDGGITWDSTLIADVPAGRELCPKALAIAPSDPQVLYVGFANAGCLAWDFGGCDGLGTPGFFRSDDGGHTWEHVVSTPFDGWSVLSLVVSLDDPFTVFAATMTGPFVSRDGGDTWEFLKELDDPAGWSPPRPGIVQPSIYVMDVDPFDAQLIYAGSPSSGVFRSTDRGETWVQAAAGMEPNTPIMDLAPDMSRPGVLYAGSRDSGVFVSTDGAQTWRKINEGLGRPEVLVMALSADGTVMYVGSNGAGVFRLGIPVQDVQVDIKPQSCPNPLNPKSKGVLPVAILGAEDFDVTTIDRGSILLEGVSPLRTRTDDVATPIEDQQDCDCTEEGPDGLTDLTLKFNKGDIVAALGQVEPGEEIVLTLTGELTGGTPIEGTDCVVITPVRAGKQSVRDRYGAPKAFALGQNTPNPFSGSTVIHYQLPEPARATLRIYDVAGRGVRTLTDVVQKAGYYSIAWDGGDEEGNKVGAGIYFYRLQACSELAVGETGRTADFTEMRKMVVLR